MFYAIPSWLAVNGASATVVGSAAAAAAAPWMAKWAVGAFMDRYTYLPMGRRRPWLVGAQCAIALAFACFAIISPAPAETTIVIGFGFLISSLTAIQDVALDALVIDITPDEEKGRLNGFMFGGKLFGIAGGTAITGYMVEHYGISAAMISMLALFAIPALAAIAIRERPGEKLLPWSPGQASAASRALKQEAWWPIFRIAVTTLFRRDTLLVIFLLVAYGFHQTLQDQGSTLFAARELGWGESKFGSLVAATNIMSGAISLLIGGWLVDRLGPRVISLTSAAIGATLLGWIALSGEFFTNSAVFPVWFIATSVSLVMFYLSFLVMAMRVSAKEVAATSFALIVATQPLGMTTGSSLLGTMEAAGGFAAIYGVSAIALVISALMTLGMSPRAAGALGRAHEVEEVLTID